MKMQRTSMSFKSWFRALGDAAGSWLGFGILIMIWIWSLVFDTPMLEILALYRFWRCKEHPCPLCSNLGLWRTLEVPDWGLGSWSLFGYGQCSLTLPSSEFWIVILILKVPRTSMSLKSWFGALEDAGCSWLWFGSWSLFGFGHLSLNGLWHLAWALVLGFGFDLCSVESRK